MPTDLDPVEVEIGLHMRDSKTWTVELRVQSGGGDEDSIWPFESQRPNFDELRQDVVDDEVYGRRLTETLFGNRDLRERFATVRAAAGDRPIRLRLFISPSAPDLHDCHWETLRDPQSGQRLLDESMHFSRYLSSRDWRPVTLPSKGRDHAVIAIANPSDLDPEQFGGRLSPVDVRLQLQKATTAIGSTKCTALASDGTGTYRRPTLENVLGAVHDGCDVLYLVCHGRLREGQPWLLLENDEGGLAPTSGVDLIEGLTELRAPLPRLIVLASCQSASGGEGAPGGPGAGSGPPRDEPEAFTALGPRLAEARIPAVVAMQGNISMETVAEFMPVFFRELRRDGEVDRAMAVARAAVGRHDDWWMPVLFTRLRSGRIWHTARFAEGFEQWRSLLREIRNRRCIAILGPAVTDALVGSRNELAWRWAKEYGFPMAPDAREDLPQVAQFIAVNQKARHHPHEELGEHLRRELLARYGDSLSDELRDTTKLRRMDLESLFSAMSGKLLEDPSEPHRLLAELPFPVYITSQQTNLMGPALTAAGRNPRVDFCRWNDDVAWPPSVLEMNPDYQPDDQNPLVFHLFGRLQQPETLVLTEDDYFDYLFRISRDPNALPRRLMMQVCKSSLLFLGFRMEDWDFRVFYRILMNQESREMFKDHPHVAVQLVPEEGRLLDVGAARRYLESYFDFGAARIGVYWGTAREFISELKERWDADLRTM